jgi:hypothetical protein
MTTASEPLELDTQTLSKNSSRITITVTAASTA